MTMAAPTGGGSAGGPDKTVPPVIDDTPPAPPLTGFRRTAIAVLLLGDEITKRIMRHFRPEHVRRLLEEAGTLRGVTEDEVMQVLEELIQELERSVPGVTGHGHSIRDAAVSVFGSDIYSALQDRDFHGLAVQVQAAAADKPDVFARTIRKEHPQTIAVILAMLPPEASGLVLRHLPAERKAEVVRRVAKLKNIPASVIAEVADTLGREFARPAGEGPLQIDGMDAAVKIMRQVGVDEEQPIMEALEQIDAETMAEVRSKLFTFEDLRILHDREIQLILREVDQRILPLAMKKASPSLQAKLLSNVSKRAAEMLMDDLAIMGPVTISQVEKAQAQILEQVMALAAEGRVNLRPGNTI
jgi:flagellar motor switch protein FliG